MNRLQAKFLDSPFIVSLEEGGSTMGPHCEELLPLYFIDSRTVGLWFLPSLQVTSWEMIVLLVRNEEKYSSLTESELNLSHLGTSIEP